MSEVVSKNLESWNWTPGEVPTALRDRLQQLRRSITSSIWVSAIGKLSLLLLAVAAVDFMLDYFLHMDRAQRAILAGLLIAGLGYAIYRLLWLPISTRTSDDALILAVERKMGQSHNPLINTLQFAREAHPDQRGYSPAMADQVIRSGLASANQLDFSQAMDHRRLEQGRWLLRLGLAGLMMALLLIAGTQTGRLWFGRNVLLADQPWPTRTRLTVKGVENGVLVVPRGEDHRLEVAIDPQCANPDVEVYVDFLSRATGARQKLRPGSDDPLLTSTTLRSVNSEFQFRVSGGDFVSDPIQIRLVQPPGFETLKLTVTPPAYSGLEPQALALSAENYKLLLGSELAIEAKSDKANSTLALLSTENRWEIPADNEGWFRFQLSGDALRSGRYRFDLQDESGISGGRPVEFSLDVLSDKPPQVRAKPFGVSNMIVPRARLPISIAVEDEFAIVGAWGQLGWRAEGVATAGDHRQDIAAFADQWGKAELSGSHVFDLETLDIPSGMTLSVQVQARDNQPEKVADAASGETNEGETNAGTTDPGGRDTVSTAQNSDADSEKSPAIGSSKTMVFRVVNEAELRADLLRREMEQTKAFERLISQQAAVLTELKALQASQPQSSETSDSFLARQNQMATKSVRNQFQVGTLLVQIADRFQGFLDEVRNNRLDDASENIDSGQSLSRRIEEQIIQPLGEIDRELLPSINRSMEVVSRSVGDASMSTHIDTVVPEIEEALRQLNAVLDAMQRTQNFQEIVNSVIAIKNDEQRLKKQAEEQKRNDKALDEIFD